MTKILKIEKQAFPKTCYSKRIFLEYAKRLSEGFVVIEVEEDIAGYIIFDRDGHIHTTAVKPECRRRGYGRMLFTYVMRFAKKRLWLEVRTRNTGAIEFYKKMGMKVVGSVQNYYGDDDALVMMLTSNEQERAGNQATFFSG